MEENPINKGYRHANMAEEYESKGLLKEAAQEHFIAAESFEMAIKFTSDIEVIRTLQLLASAHGRHSFELERRFINKFGYKRHSMSTNGDNEEDNFIKSNSREILLNTVTYKHTLTNPKFKSGSLNSASNYSSHVLDNSYLFQSNDTYKKGDESDPFDRFWETIEELVQNTFSPSVTNPALFGDIRKADIQDVRQEHTEDNTETKGMLGSFVIVPEHLGELGDINEGSIDISGTGPESLHTTNTTSSVTTIEEYIAENQHLKTTIDTLLQHIAALDTVAKENAILKNSILQLRQTIYKQVKGNRPERSRIYDYAHKTNERDDEVTTQSKIQDLEEKVRFLSIENENQSTMLNRYRDRWDKLQKSAKKKNIPRMG